MAAYDLSEEQKNLLRIIVEKDRLFKEKNKSRHSYYLVIAIGDLTIIDVGEFNEYSITDLIEISKAGLIDLDKNKPGEYKFILSNKAIKAVENNFTFPEEPPAAEYIGVKADLIIGTIQGIGQANNSNIQQNINDPKLLEAQINILTDQLLEVVKNELLPETLAEYQKNIAELKEEIKSEKPRTNVLRRLFGALAFMGDVEGTISLAVRVWPLVYPILRIVAEKIC